MQKAFCMNCLQGFQSEISRDKHFEYCKDNETVRIEMPKEGSLVNFQDGQDQFKVPFVMYADFEAILEAIERSTPNPDRSYTKEINKDIRSGLCVNRKFAYGEVENPLKLYRGEDCVEVFPNEARRLYHMFSKKPVKHLNREQWREIIIEQLSARFSSKNLRYRTQRLEIIVIILGNIENLPIGTVI